jgi:hypothetical protein
MHTLIQDLRHALRGMRLSPGFSAVAFLCLALGIGTNTALFTVVNAVLIRSLPVDHPERLILFRHVSKGRSSVRHSNSGYGSTSLSYATFQEFRAGSKTLARVFAFVPLGFNNQSVSITAGAAKCRAPHTSRAPQSLRCSGSCISRCGRRAIPC